jgi:hypothetical protein
VLESKDKNIGELEKEFAATEDEIDGELTQLSYRLTNENERA